MIRSKCDGFSIPELIMAVTLSIILSAGVTTIVFFFGRDINRKFYQEQAVVQTERAGYIIKEDLLNTGRGAGSFTSPIHVAKNGKYIKFQVLTLDNDGLLVSKTTNSPNWGDGSGPSGLGHWIMYKIDGNDLVREILPNLTATTPLKKKIILHDAIFHIDPIQYDLNSVDLLTCANCTGEFTSNTRVLRITVGKKDSSGHILYSKTFTIKLRNG